MIQRHFVTLVILSATLAYAQSSGNTVTVTASRPSAVQPDQVVFSVYVTSGLNASREDAVAALLGSGITLANFSGVSTVPLIYDPSGQSQLALATTLQWSFNLPAPLANIKSTTATLTGIQMSVAKANNGMAVSFSVSGTQVSAQALQTQPCPTSDLVADARTQAQKIASAASMSLGSILGMTAGSASSSGVCTLTVKFALGGF